MRARRTGAWLYPVLMTGALLAGLMAQGARAEQGSAETRPTLPTRLELPLPADMDLKDPPTCVSIDPAGRTDSSRRVKRDTSRDAGRRVQLEQSFVDDFDSFDLKEERWLPYYDGGYDPVKDVFLGGEWGAVKRTLSGNQEQQIYVDPDFKGTGKVPLGRNPFSVEGGVLSITASRIPEDLRGALFGFEFESGLLTSRASLVQQYGYFEMRAHIPSGKALWPAFWLLPADKSWPPEIDILEVVGQRPDEMAYATHFLDGSGNRKSTGCKVPLSTAPDGFHLYGALWTQDQIIYYIDRRPVAYLKTPDSVKKPMYMLLNLAVGGNMVGRADGDTPLPSRLQVDWVAAWNLPNHPPCITRLLPGDMLRCHKR